jgi:hypothetical protein
VVGEIGLGSIFSNNPKASAVRKVGMLVNLHQQMTNALKSQVACCAMQSKAKWCNCSSYTPKQMLQQRVIEWQSWQIQ